MFLFRCSDVQMLVFATLGSEARTIGRAAELSHFVYGRGHPEDDLSMAWQQHNLQGGS